MSVEIESILVCWGVAPDADNALFNMNALPTAQTEVFSTRRGTSALHMMTIIIIDDGIRDSVSRRLNVDVISFEVIVRVCNYNGQETHNTSSLISERRLDGISFQASESVKLHMKPTTKRIR